MRDENTQDSKTVSMYELHAVNLLKSINLLSPDDCSENIKKSRNYMLVQQVANSVYIQMGGLTYEEIGESIQKESNQDGLTKTISETGAVIYWGVPEHLDSYEKHIANLRNHVS
jgi:hypothetical protein